MPALHSCAASQKVIPACGNRSEIGIIAEPIMPKACSMPCICRTLTKASSVVIFMMRHPSTRVSCSYWYGHTLRLAYRWRKPAQTVPINRRLLPPALEPDERKTRSSLSGCHWHQMSLSVGVVRHAVIRSACRYGHAPLLRHASLQDSVMDMPGLPARQ